MEKITDRTGIFHEHQQGALCAQHALNNLLQNPLFLADSLADIARELDKEESSVLTHASYESENMDDTGFFNIQVLQRALAMFDIELVPFGSQELVAQQARSAPASVQAYICNLGAHWFTVRRFAQQYFNLNSIYYVPELIPNQMISKFLNLVQNNGYSVFIVNGNLPSCLADQILDVNPISYQEYQSLTKNLPKLIMDGQVMGGPNGRLKNGNLLVHVPPDIYKELEKNPNNPHIRQMILDQIAESGIQEDIPEGATGGKNQRRPRRILIASMSESEADGPLIGMCDCPNCTQHSAFVTEQRKVQISDHKHVDRPNEPQQKPQMITRQIAPVIVSESNSTDSNAPRVQRRKVTRALVIVTQRTSASLVDDNDVPQMNRPSIENENDDNDDLLLKHAIAQSLLDQPDMNSDVRHSLLLQQEEQSYQEMVDEFIAASMYLNELEERHIEQKRKLLSTVIMASEASGIEPPPSLLALLSPPTTTTTDVHSPPSTNINSISPNTSLPAPPNTPVSPPLTNTSTAPLPPPSPTTTYSTPTSPTTTDLSPSTSTNSDSVQSPTVEELRQQRLQAHGNRHKSIISVQSNFDD